MAETLHITSQGSGLPLVLIHGWGLNSGVWQPLIDKLSPFLKVITIDLPGYGLNINRSVNPYSLANICQKIIETVDEPAVYAGWSLGGLVATQIAHSYTDKTLGLVSIASSPYFLEDSSPQSTHCPPNPPNENVAAEPQKQEVLTWPGIKAPLLASFHQQLAKDTQKTIDGFLKIQAMGSPHIRDDLSLIRDLIFQYPMPNRQTLDDSLALLETVDLRPILCTISQPFLRLYGRLDSLVPKTVPALVDDIAQQSEKHIFMHASHAPFISHADEFLEILLAWLIKEYSLQLNKNVGLS